MRIQNLQKDQSGVSPVIGVILMVAITVILAAVIGTFVLNIGGSTQESAPQATFKFTDEGEKTFHDASGYSGEYRAITVVHDGGEAIDYDNINVTINGKLAYAIRDENVTVTEANRIAGVPSPAAQRMVIAPFALADSIDAGETATIIGKGPNSPTSAGGVSPTVRPWDEDGIVTPFIQTDSNFGLSNNGNAATATGRSEWLLDDGDTIRIVWTGSSGSGTILAEYTI